jgi:GT2 family glycosyltransferase
MTISVVIVNWNRRALLQASLASLVGQKYRDFEVIVVDNGSADGSVEWLQDVAPTFPVSLRIIQNTENKGFCAANNQGIQISHGEFVALLNNDAEADPNWLAELLGVIRGARDSDHVGMVASKILVWETPEKIDKVGHLIYPDGQNRGRGAGEIDRGQYDRVEEVLWPDGCACLYRRAMLDEIGGFDEDFFAYADDAELGLRGRIAGWSSLYAPGAVVRHHRGATLGLTSTRRLTLIERNRILLVVKHFPWTLLWANGVHTGIRIAGGIRAAARNQGEIRRYPGLSGKLRVAQALLMGMLSALPLIPKMLAKRRAFRPLRRLNAKQVRTLLKRYRISLKEISEQSI